MNILTFDIEEWYIEKAFGSDRKFKYEEYDRILDIILDNLSNKNIKATFFCLGKIAEHFPEIIKKIASQGHEIGCHSHIHTWINKITPEKFKDDTLNALSFLEDSTGEKIKSYRAPAFSICESNKWAFEILAECGIENDASVFPASRDFGGFPSFTSQKPVKVDYKGVTINEFPIPIGKLPLLNKHIAFSGGGYFRLLPYSIIKRMAHNSDYNMFYFHIGDLLPEKTKMLSRRAYESYFKEDGSLKNRMIRHFKTNVGRKSALSNLISLLNSFDFLSIAEFNRLYPINKSINI